MTTLKSKANVGTILILLFFATTVTGIILHLKTHEIIVEPHNMTKNIHWLAGIIMVGFACWHSFQFQKMLTAMKTKCRWFWGDTWVAVLFICLTVITGLVKLLSPVKIPHLGLWHYWLGMIMSVAIIVHLFRGIPSWIRLKKVTAKKETL